MEWNKLKFNARDILTVSKTAQFFNSNIRSFFTHLASETDFKIESGWFLDKNRTVISETVTANDLMGAWGPKMRDLEAVFPKSNKNQVISSFSV